MEMEYKGFVIRLVEHNDTFSISLNGAYISEHSKVSLAKKYIDNLGRKDNPFNGLKIPAIIESRYTDSDFSDCIITGIEENGMELWIRSNNARQKVRQSMVLLDTPKNRETITKIKRSCAELGEIANKIKQEQKELVRVDIAELKAKILAEKEATK